MSRRWPSMHAVLATPRAWFPRNARALLLVAMLCASLPAAAASCDWTRDVLPADRPQLDIDLARLQALLDVPGSAPLADPDAAAAQARALLQRARAPLPLGTINGPWSVRSIQANGQSVFAYPWFAARIDTSGCTMTLRKSTGSQRRSGRLYREPAPDRGGSSLVFLGSATVNDNRTAPYSARNQPSGSTNGGGDGSPVNSTGRLWRIGRNELLLVLDAAPNGFELYHLKR